ncbi:MAG: hypothetical protein ACLFS5_12470, partial [Spirochaetaceae bacterium]
METGERPEHVATGESAQSGADRRIDEGRYREDLATIRALVAEHDDQPLLEHWAFIAWGLLIAAGTVFHWLVAPGYSGGGRQLALLIWIPVVTAGAVQEIIAFVRRLNTEEVPLSTRKIKQLLLQGAGVFIVLFSVLIYELPSGIHPGIVMLFGALAMLPYGHATYGALFVEAFTLIAAGLLVLFAAPATPRFF